MTTLIIRSNIDTLASVFVTDMGFLIPAGGAPGGVEIFSDLTNLKEASESFDLRTFATDGLFPGGSESSANSLILNDGLQDIPPEGVDDFLGKLATTRLPRVYGEALTGLINGANTIFTTAVPFVPGAEVVYFNGVRQQEGLQSDYVRAETVPGNGFDQITFVVAPRARPNPKVDDNVTVDYDTA